MSRSFFNTVLGIIFTPRATFKELHDETLLTAYYHFLTASAVLVVLLTTLVYTGFDYDGLGVFSRAPQYVSPVQFVLLSALALIFLPWFWGIYVHAWVLLAGGKQGINATFKAVFYGELPLAVFGWIPIIRGIGGIWGLITLGIGIRELQRISTKRTVVIMFGSVGIPLILLFLSALLLSPVAPFHGASPGTSVDNDITQMNSPLLLTKQDLPETLKIMRIAVREREKLPVDMQRDGGTRLTDESFMKNGQTEIGRDGYVLLSIFEYPDGTNGTLIEKEVWFYDAMSSGDGGEKLPCPDLGEISRCYKLHLNGMKTTGSNEDTYMILFSKNCVYEKMVTVGPFTDFELMKDIAQRASAKIPL